MADHTAIEWCDSTFNPWIGCTRVSPACDHCYAAVSTPARAGGIEWGAGQPRQRTSPGNWKLPLRWNASRFWQCTTCGLRGDDATFQKAGHPLPAYPTPTSRVPVPCYETVEAALRRVFCASLADVFDNEVDPTWRRDLFELILRTPDLDWLLLTKRIGNVPAMLEELKQRARYHAEWALFDDWLSGRPPANVWLGATICNQAEASRDIPKLLAIPAAVRFLSIEPMLGPVDLSYAFAIPTGAGKGSCPMHLSTICPEGLLPLGEQHLHWVIAGGESGTEARPMHPSWVRALRDQCAAAGVPFLFKQWGEWAPHSARAGGDEGGGLRRGHVRYLTGDGREADGHFRRGDAAVVRVGKKAAGRTLDGVEHTAFPEIHHV
ncbi:DUF5131 family protein [Luteimonas saliphila]|uniref:DUF5131 family protein n=1 Tax=Luteimonas saliphila TaxID=2804919 RepID=UPI00192D8F21